MSLKNELKELATAEKRKGRAAYVKIVRRSGKPQANDAAELHRLAGVLGYGMARVEKDIDLVAEATDLASAARDLAALEKDWEEKEATYRQSCEHRESEEKRLAEVCRDADIASSHAKTALSECKRAADRLATLRKDFPELLGK